MGKVYIKSSQGEDDYCVLINEHPESGYSFKFLDFEPKDIENYKAIYISFTDLQSEIDKLKEENQRLLENNTELAGVRKSNKEFYLEQNRKLRKENYKLKKWVDIFTNPEHDFFVEKTVENNGHPYHVMKPFVRIAKDIKKDLEE